MFIYPSCPFSDPSRQRGHLVPHAVSPVLHRACVLVPLSSVAEGELEAEWLQDVGLSTLLSGEEEEDGKALLSTLTRTQAAAVKKRYNTYTQTLRRKSKQPVRDVRDIFGVSEAPVSVAELWGGWAGQRSTRKGSFFVPPLCAKCLPSRQTGKGHRAQSLPQTWALNEDSVQGGESQESGPCVVSKSKGADAWCWGRGRVGAFVFRKSAWYRMKAGRTD